MDNGTITFWRLEQANFDDSGEQSYCLHLLLVVSVLDLPSAKTLSRDLYIKTKIHHGKISYFVSVIGPNVSQNVLTIITNTDSKKKRSSRTITQMFVIMITLNELQFSVP